MRIFSLFTAVLVMATLYALVFERDRILVFAGAQPEDKAAVADSPVANGQAAEEPKRIAVVARHSAAREIEHVVLLRGRTEAARQVQVMAETSGRVISEPLQSGTMIETGQTLCAIDPGTRLAALTEAEARLPEARARLAEAAARVTEAEINDRAARALSAGGYASDTRVAAAAAAVESALAAVQSAEAGLDAAAAGVAAAETEIERLTIVAPFGGLLESDTAELGALMQPGAPCAEIIQLDPIMVVGFVAETEVDRVSVGVPAAARLATGREVLGRVTFLSRSADPETRTFRVEIEVANPDYSISEGQTAEIGISSDGEMAHLLPGSALTLNDEGALGVRVAEDGVARFYPVALLRDTVEGVWLTGLPETADVIVVGQEYVTDGVAVEVTLREARP